MNIVISQPMFFPWVGLFEQICLADVYVHYDDVQYSKGSFTNRVQIWNGSKVDWLSIPVSKRHLNENINQVTIDQSKNWQQKHRKKLEQGYARATYRDEMLDVVSTVYSQSHDSISSLSIKSIETVCDYFGLLNDKRFVRSSDLGILGHSTQRVLDIVKNLQGDTYITGHGAQHYLEHTMFEQQKIDVRYMLYQKKVYPQLIPNFTPYISVLDLIANCGTKGKQYICSNSQNWKEFFK